MITSNGGAKPQAARRRAATRPADSAVQVRSTWRLGGRRKPAIFPLARCIFWASGRGSIRCAHRASGAVSALRVAIPDAKARSPSFGVVGRICRYARRACLARDQIKARPFGSLREP